MSLSTYLIRVRNKQRIYMQSPAASGGNYTIIIPLSSTHSNNLNCSDTPPHHQNIIKDIRHRTTTPTTTGKLTLLDTQLNFILLLFHEQEHSQRVIQSNSRKCTPQKTN